MSHLLKGCYKKAIEIDENGFNNYEEALQECMDNLPKFDIARSEIESILGDFEHSAYLFLKTKETNLARKQRRRNTGSNEFELPLERRKPVNNVWQYAYLITGEKKIGKTSFAIEGCEEYVLQFDKPQLSYSIRESMIKSWKESAKAIKALEQAADSNNFPYNRIIIDGVAEWYAMCQVECCKHFGISHPSEQKWAEAWHWIRDNFTDAVNRLLRLQISAECGIIFIAHAEWTEVKIRGGTTVDKLVPNLSAKCEETINGKVDGWFCYDYDGEDRVLILKGDQTTGAGHRIDGKFQTPSGEYIKEIPMGNNVTESMEYFIKAFNNKHEFVTLADFNESNKSKSTRRRRRSRRKEK